MCGKCLAMHAHLPPSLRLIHSSPDVVPKYRPTVGSASALIAWRFTVSQACDLGRPSACRFHVLPPFFEQNTAGFPPGLVRGQTSVPSIGKTQSVSGSRGCTVMG